MESYRVSIEGVVYTWLDADELQHRLTVALSDLDSHPSLSEPITNGEIEIRELDDCKLTQICPRDDSVLESRIFDIDGTNIEEHKVCLKCGYGKPALW